MFIKNELIKKKKENNLIIKKKNINVKEYTNRKKKLNIYWFNILK